MKLPQVRVAVVLPAGNLILPTLVEGLQNYHILQISYLNYTSATTLLLNTDESPVLHTNLNKITLNSVS